MLDKFQHHLKTTFPNIFETKLLLACSAGVDSMVLADLALKSGLKFALAHCNYKLRDTDADLDQELVESWGEKNSIQVFTRTFDLSQEKGSVQLKAREYRYQWFLSLLITEEYDYVLTAHHANDNEETFLINLLRGTGLDGLTGIPEKNGFLFRTLLPFSKEEIVSYAKANGVEWREDRSNQEPKYVRNKIRLEVLPILNEINPDFSKSFEKTQSFLASSAKILENHADELRSKLFQKGNNGIHISVEDLIRLHPLDGYLHLLFKSYGFTQWEDLKKILYSESGKEIRSVKYRLIKDRGTLILSELILARDKPLSIYGDVDELYAPIHLIFEKVTAMGETSRNTVYLDKEKLNYPLKLRKWKIGDYFYPFGMQGRKKLSKFFKDEKYNTLEKENQWVLCSDKNIVWVVGKRLDERFKVTQATKKILKITYAS